MFRTDALVIVAHQDLVLPDQYYVETHHRQLRPQMPPVTSCRGWLVAQNEVNPSHNASTLDSLLFLLRTSLPSAGEMIIECAPTTIGHSHV